MKDIKAKLSSINKKIDKKLFGILIIISLFYIYISIQEVASVKGIGRIIQLSYAMKFVLVWLLITISICYIYSNRKIKIHKLFLILIIPASIFYATIFLPGATPDEELHFKNAFSLASHLTGENGKMTESELEYLYPQNVNSDSRGYVLNLLNDSNHSKMINDNYDEQPYMQLFAYWPQVLGVIVARTFNANIIIETYLARMFNLLLYVLFTYYAIKIIPNGKELLMITALMPMSMQQAVSASYDVEIIGASFFIIAYSVSYWYDDAKIKKTGIYVLLLISIMELFFVKGKAYTPLLLLFLIPAASRLLRKKFPQKYKYIMWIAITLIFVILIGVIYKLASDNMPMTGSYLKWCKKKSYGLGYVINYPLDTLMVILKTYIPWDNGIGLTGRILPKTAVGSNLSWLNLNLSMSIITIWMALLGAGALVVPENCAAIKKSEKWLMIFVSIGVITAVSLGMMLYWTPFGSPDIAGLQGRYYIPVIVPMLFVFQNNFFTIKGNRLRGLHYLIPFIISITMIEIIVGAYAG